MSLRKPSATIINIAQADRRQSDSRSLPHINNNGSPKAQEYQNMVRHILGKINKRRRPPTALVHLAEQCRSMNSAEEFDNEDLVDLLIQLRTALSLCQKSGVGDQVLSQRERDTIPISSQQTSPLSSPRFPDSEGASSIHSPATTSISMFDKIVAVLNDLILNDCRYKSSNPKPSRPPYMLQYVVIDISTVLVSICKDIHSVNVIGTCMLPAFDVFPEGSLLGKLLGFFIDILIPSIMEREENIPSSPRASQDGQSYPLAPTINISGPESSSSERNRENHLTIDTHLSLSHNSVSLRSPQDGLRQEDDATQYIALFPPLLYFMARYLAPYLSSVGNGACDSVSQSITMRSQSLYSFHRALQFMIQKKPDFYLDILQVIALGTSDVKYRACQILFHYYDISAGHIVVAEPLPVLGYEEEYAELEKLKERQDYEEARQQQQQQQQQNTIDPSSLNAMMMGSSPSLNVAGINRKYRPGPSPNYLPRQQSVDEMEDHLSMQKRHAWYPHIFAEYSKYQAEELSIQTQRLSTGIQTLGVTIHDDMNGAYCSECFKLIKGYGLRCYRCKCSVHYGCSAGEDQDIMLYVKEGGIQKVVSPQFCHIPPQPRANVFYGNESEENYSLPVVSAFGHQFHLINLFTLILCAVCRLPLWGISLQGYRCSVCNKFVHSSCLSACIKEKDFRRKHPNIQTCQPYQPLLESDTRISYESLCTDLKDYYGDLLPSSEEDLHGRKFEEVGTILSILMLQDNILQCGITSGCLLVSHEDEDPLHSDNNNLSESPRYCPLLQRGMDICMAYLSSGSCHASTFLSDFYVGRHHNLEACVLSKEEYLAHVAAMMKAMATCKTDQGPIIKASPHITKEAHGYLRLETAQQDKQISSSRGEVCTFELPRETMEKNKMVSWLMDTLEFKSIAAVKILIQHMRNLGLIENLNGTPALFPNEELNSTLRTTGSSGNKCVFPIPFAIDYSPNVELLLNTIDACLSDIDISINECGMLLLTRRCWPDPFMSFYTSSRLIESILSWIFQEDEKLTALHAGYIANKQALPGVRTNRWTQAAQNALLSRMKGASSSGDRNRQSVSFANSTGLSSGAGIVYVTTRNALRDRYIVRWMGTLHDIDPDAYASMLHDMLERIIEGKREEPSIPDWISKEDRQRSAVQRFEEFLGYLLKLKACGVIFSAMDPILQRWLDKTQAEFHMEGILDEKQPVDIRSLAKLCSSKVSISKGSPDSGKHATDMSGQTFDVISSLFTTQDTEDIERGIRWLTLIMHAGTGVPYSILAKIARLLIASQVPLYIIAEFTKLLWFQAVNILNINVSRAAIIDVIGYLNEMALEALQSKGNEYSYTAEELECVQKFIRYSAALTCFSYNCPLANITNLDLVPYFGDHIAQLSQNKRATMHPDAAQIMNVDNSTPIIRCMLTYLKMDELNVKEHVIKMFYALIFWGFGISDKSDFVEKCMEPLVTAVWEMLPPMYDATSDITLNLLMKLMNVDPQCFLTCVYQVFENKDWEVRFLGLDNLYGLFTKMDAAFQTKWLPMLAHLGPVFSYFVASLFDKEEYVRSKALAMIRTFGTLHLRSAFRCWEAYFLTATEMQRIPVVKLMTRLNALFPDWQVIQWESLLEALESKQGKSSDTESIDILEQYMRPGGSSKQDSETKQDEMETLRLAETENSKISMLVLAMQMLTNHLAINTIQMSRLKYAFVSLMGFEDCQRYSVSGEWHVSFGNLSFDPSLPSQSAFVTTCSRHLKMVMDSFAPLPAETVASMAPEMLERNRVELAENSSPGVHFIDVVIKLFNSNIDLTAISHATLKIWLETVLIVVYKHNILEHEIEQGIVSCMKHIIELLTRDISEENKLLILEILKYLLRRSDHLTAMVLSRQIMALGKLLTKLGSQPSDPVFLKAKEFLKSAFLRFAVAGLFVLMFKNQTVSDSNNRDVDLFFVLKTVIDPKDIVPEEDTQEIVYLRDQPIRDVLDKLMKQQMERRAFSTVLYNMCRYVETVHSHPYSEFILNDYAVFLNSLAKHTTGWRRSDWDINPIFTMSAILLKEHPYHFAILLPQILAIFRHGLQNCIIRPESVAKLLYAYSTLQSIPGVQPENAFMQIILEEVKATLATRAKLHKDTFLTLIELILWDTSPEYMDWFRAAEGQHSYHHQRYFEQGLPSLLEPLAYFVKTPPVTQLFTKTEYRTYCAVSKLLAIMCVQSETAFSKLLELQKMDELRPTLRFFNWFLLAVLREKSSVILFEQLMAIEDTIRELILQALHSIPVGFDRIDDSFAYNASGELLTQSFLLIKAWTLLGQPHKSSFWMSVWPGIRRLLDSVDPAMLGVAGSNGVFLWKHFLSVVQFLFACRSDAVLVNAYEWNLFLDILLEQDLVNADNPCLEDLLKQAATVKEMFTTPAIQVSPNTLIDQLFLELRDIMRLQAETVQLQSNSNSSSRAFLPTMAAEL